MPSLDADESMIRWYGVGVSYVDAEIPHYAAIERKPDNGAEIQNLADVALGIMLRLKIVKSAAEEEAIAAAAADEDDDEDVVTNEGGKGTRVPVDCHPGRPSRRSSSSVIRGTSCHFRRSQSHRPLLIRSRRRWTTNISGSGSQATIN